MYQDRLWSWGWEEGTSPIAKQGRCCDTVFECFSHLKPQLEPSTENLKGLPEKPSQVPPFPSPPRICGLDWWSGMMFSYLCVSVARLDEKNVHTEAIKRKHKEFLDSWNPLVFLKNPSRVAEVCGSSVGSNWIFGCVAKHLVWRLANSDYRFSWSLQISDCRHCWIFCKVVPRKPRSPAVSPVNISKTICSILMKSYTDPWGLQASPHGMVDTMVVWHGGLWKGSGIFCWLKMAQHFSEPELRST